MRSWNRWLAIGTASLATAALSAHPGPPTDPDDLLPLLTRVAERVETYFSRAQSLVCQETVRLQPIATDLMPEGRERNLEYELRIEWEPASEERMLPQANIVRQLLTVDGRPPKPGAEPGCTDPRPVSPEPLEMLLPGHREEYAFTPAGSGRLAQRAALLLDYRGRTPGTPEVLWHGDCVSVSLPGRTRGRVWIDATTDDVLQLEERLVGLFDFRVPVAQAPGGPGWMVIERADSSIRYRPISFTDPEETLMLPESIQSVTVVRGAAVPRLRTTQTFSHYRRFVTDAHIVKNQG